jgi:hypothetical protein
VAAQTEQTPQKNSGRRQRHRGKKGKGKNADGGNDLGQDEPSASGGQADDGCAARAESTAGQAEDTPRKSGARRRPPPEKRRAVKSRSLSRDRRQLSDNEQPEQPTTPSKAPGRGSNANTPGQRTIAAAHLSPRTPRRRADNGASHGHCRMCIFSCDIRG